jgi:Uma2 family endonuclease
MSAAPKQFVTPEQYLAMERQAEIKSEYYAGELFAMAGGSKEHNRIVGNVFGLLWTQLRDSPCTPYTTDMKVRSWEGHYAYPDVTVVCGEEEFADNEKDVLLNPTLIVEVLSPTTESWDRRGKFEQYQQRESLQEYLLIAQDRPHVERYTRQSGGEWLLTEINGVNGVLALPSIGGELPLCEVYRNITLPESAGRR